MASLQVLIMWYGACCRQSDDSRLCFCQTGNLIDITMFFRNFVIFVLDARCFICVFVITGNCGFWVVFFFFEYCIIVTNKEKVGVFGVFGD